MEPYSTPHTEHARRYRKKPVVIEAWQLHLGNTDQVAAWCGGEVTMHAEGDHVVITTLEGNVVAGPGDWVIKGVAGEFYPCKPGIFNATYESEATL